jgi:hypothetical protein
MKIAVFWVVTPCGLVSRYQLFGETLSIFRVEVIYYTKEAALKVH